MPFTRVRSAAAAGAQAPGGGTGSAAEAGNSYQGTGYLAVPDGDLPAAQSGFTVLAATLMIHYTEGLPFLAACFGLNVAMGFVRRRWDTRCSSRQHPASRYRA